MSTRTRLVLTLTASGALCVLCMMLLPAGSLALSWAGPAIELLAPRWLWLVALTPWLWGLATKSRALLTPRRRRFSIALRCLLLNVLALALACPVTTSPARRTSTVFLVDVSDSNADAALTAASAYIERARRVAFEQPVELVTFAREARRVALGAAPTRIARHPDGAATNLERALALARGLLRPDHIPQLVLFSDLRETHGASMRALAHLRASRVALWLAPEVSHAQPEVGIRSLSIPQHVRAGETFALQAELFSRAPAHVRVRLLRNGSSDPLAPGRALSLPAGSSSLTFHSLARSAGKVSYRLELSPQGPDHFAENNHFERSIRVIGPQRVLYVERTRDQAAPLAALLRDAGFEVDVRIGASAPERLDELANVAFYLLSDVPAADLSQASMRAIVRFVSDGGGFMMAGGDQAFGPGGYRGTALEAILPVTLDGSLRRSEPSLALMLAIDKSGSMAGEKLECAKEAARATAELLAADSYLGVIGFDAEPLRVVRLAVASERASMARSIATLAAGGGTALFPALDAAYADLAGVRARVKHVVILTDGQSQEEALDMLVQSMRADGITVSAVGVGDDVNRGLLSALARHGGGRAYFTRDPNRVPRLFTEEAELVARSPLVERALYAQQLARSDFLRGVNIASAPALHGIVSTRPRAAPSELVLATQHGDPLLARMRSGLGWSLAFTSDLKSRWSADWYRWRELPTLVTQLVREHMRRDREADLTIDARSEDDTLHATLDVLSESEHFANGLAGELTSTGPDGRRERATFAQVAPGRYEALLPLRALGSYLLEAQLRHGDEAPRFARGELAYAFPAEYAPVPRDDARAAFIGVSGAAPLPEPDRLFAARASPLRARRECWAPLIWLALTTFLLELAVRRVPVSTRKNRQALDASS